MSPSDTVYCESVPLSKTPTLAEQRESLHHQQDDPEDVEKRQLDLDSQNRPSTVNNTQNGDVENVDEIVVDWDPNDIENPKNWSYGRKWAATLVVSSFTFITPVSSSMIAPACRQVAHDFGFSSEVLQSLLVSIFVLAFAIGPLFLGPLSEMYGRVRVIRLSNLFYLAWNIGCGFAQNETQLLIFRFLAGLGGSAPLSVGAGVLSDVWEAEQRGQAMALYSLAPMLGPVVAPVTGAWISQKTTWRWVFWSTSIVDGVIFISGLIFLRETYGPHILARRALCLKKALAAKGKRERPIRTIYDSLERSWKMIIMKGLFRPFHLFFHEFIVQLLGAYMAFVYGVFYLYLALIATIFEDTYGMSVGIAGLNYIAFGLGVTLASQLNARNVDRIYVYLKRRNHGQGEPEFRLPSMVPGTIMLPIGLLLTGWTAQYKVHWAATDAGLFLVGAGMILNFQTIQMYVIDAFTLYSASALAAVSFLRALAGFGFPLFAPAMYNALGYGKGDTILAVAGIVIGCPAPWLFWHFGKRIRTSSRYAAAK